LKLDLAGTGVCGGDGEGEGEEEDVSAYCSDIGTNGSSGTILILWYPMGVASDPIGTRDSLVSRNPFGILKDRRIY
jgi:hypothetical protein